jgi:hypothetical protein
LKKIKSSRFFFGWSSLQVYDWILGFMNYNSSSIFGVIDYFFQDYSPGALRNWRNFQFSRLCLPSLKLGLLFCVKSYSSSLSLGVIESFLQELCSWNLDEFKKLSLAIFAAIGLKRGLLFCTEEWQCLFVFPCYWIIFAWVTHLNFRKILKFDRILDYLRHICSYCIKIWYIVLL